MVFRNVATVTVQQNVNYVKNMGPEAICMCVLAHDCDYLPGNYYNYIRIVVVVVGRY